MDFLWSAFVSLTQIYCWGFFISLAFFLLVMLARGAGTEGYTQHVMACVLLSLIWPQSWWEIVMRLMEMYHG